MGSYLLGVVYLIFTFVFSISADKHRKKYRDGQKESFTPMLVLGAVAIVFGILFMYERGVFKSIDEIIGRWV